MLQNCGFPCGQHPVFVKTLKSYILHARKVRFFNLVEARIRLKEAYLCCEHAKFILNSDNYYEREMSVSD